MLRLRLLIILFLFAISAEARRMNPELVKPQATNQAQAIKAPTDFRCTSCPLPLPAAPINGRVWESEVRDLATWQRLSSVNP